MTKLRTLKDLTCEGYSCHHDTDLGDVCINCLKKEAIKWVNELEKFYQYHAAMILARFHDITEEDLK